MYSRRGILELVQCQVTPSVAVSRIPSPRLVSLQPWIGMFRLKPLYPLFNTPLSLFCLLQIVQTVFVVAGFG